jgi:hypothetical protein
VVTVSPHVISTVGRFSVTSNRILGRRSALFQNPRHNSYTELARQAANLFQLERAHRQPASVFCRFSAPRRFVCFGRGSKYQAASVDTQTQRGVTSVFEPSSGRGPLKIESVDLNAYLIITTRPTSHCTEAAQAIFLSKLRVFAAR